MDQLSSEIIICQDVRPCYAKGKKALFHKWVEHKYPVSKGQAAYTTGLIEYEDGSCDEIAPKQIKFCDNKILDFAFLEEEGTK